jgi:hypothetical protein
MNEKNELNETAKETIDRRLGDEWSDWAGDLSKYEAQVKDGRGLFLLFYFSALFVITLCVMGVYYMIAPRLFFINPALDRGVMWGTTIVMGLIYVYSLLLLLTAVTGINFILFSGSGGVHVEWIYPFVYKIGSIFGISKDRIGHSLVKVNNAVIYTTKRKFTSTNLLVLLPRCLDKEARTKLTEITQKYGCQSFTATGGSSARQMLKKVRPDAVIAVACERDLVSGLSDAPHYMPIIAITNRRPNGPCKDTLVDMDEFEKAVKFLSKK